VWRSRFVAVGGDPEAGPGHSARRFLGVADPANKKSKTGVSMLNATAKYRIGQVVRHRKYGFRGIIFDVDPQFANTDEWYESIPRESRPRKDQPFYHLLAENQDKTTYVAYVSEQNLLLDESDEPIVHPGISDYFDGMRDGCYVSRHKSN
jgi:heat shock protein HspQ